VSDRIANTIGLAAVPFERARSNLTINIWPSRDGHPLGDVSVNIPWLAFCSGTYLKREGRLVPLPAAILHHTRDRFAYTDKTETFEDTFGLPRTVDLFTSKSLYQASNDDFDKEYFSEIVMRSGRRRLHRAFRKAFSRFTTPFPNQRTSSG